MNLRTVASLSDHELLRKLAELVSHDRLTTVALLAHLGEVDVRRLYLPAGYSSVHVYCVRELHMSDDAAFKRIRVARLGRVYPAILEALAEGRLHMRAVLSLSTHLSPSATDELIAAATHKTRDEVDLMLARRYPQPDLATIVRAVPLPQNSAPAPTSRPDVSSMQLAPGRVILTEAEQVPVALAAVPAQIPLQSPAQLQAPAAMPPPRAARTRPVGSRGKSDERHIPVIVRSEVWRRDGGQCTITSDRGHRCESRTRLEFDHIQAVACGGRHATASGLRLRCRAHDQYEAERAFGAGFMKQKREAARRVRERGPEASGVSTDSVREGHGLVRESGRQNS